MSSQMHLEFIPGTGLKQTGLRSQNMSTKMHLKLLNFHFFSQSPLFLSSSFSPESYDWGYLNNSLMVQVGSLQHDFISDSQRRSPI